MITIWHNPRCSKSRQTLALLQEHGHAPTIRLYLEDAPSADEIKDTLARLNIPAIKMTRTTEAEFKAQALSKSSPEADLIAAMAKTPKLIERPIVFANDKAAIGRPPEAVLDIL